MRRDAVLGRNRLGEGTGLEVAIDGPLRQHPCALVFQHDDRNREPVNNPGDNRFDVADVATGFPDKLSFISPH